MTTSTWFDDLPVLGELPSAQAIEKLRELDEIEAADALEAARNKATRKWRDKKETWWPFQDKEWQHTAHAFGYLAPTPTGGVLQPVQNAGNVPADTSLMNGRIKITLGQLRVANYPGGSTHHVLLDFYAQNQVSEQTEDLHWNATFRVREGQRAAVLNFPIFVGLNVGREGVTFRCMTVNVKNESDETFLGFLDSDEFKKGLKLMTALQPAIGPLSKLAEGLTRAIASRNRNVIVQKFELGLDFSELSFGARLAEGSYLVVQVPERLHTMWDWSKWMYSPSSGQVVNQDDPTQLIPYNFLVFNVSRFRED
jgi:hypothetical protein